MELEKNNTRQNTLVSKAWSKLFPKPRRCWLPTGCMKLLEVLHAALPKMSLIASDFSFLPDVKIPGERAPLVSTKKDGCSSDYNNYLDAKGDADIFFPTDFWLLERIDHYCSGWLKLQKDKSSSQGKKRRTITLDTSAFMEEFGLPSKTRTKDGYNPLLDDFKNTKFYLSVPTHNIKELFLDLAQDLWARMEGCCSGIESLNAAAQTTPDRQAVCNCLKTAAATMNGINYSLASGLPSKCGVSIPYQISPSTDYKSLK
ncbi:hypothetical protein V6N12_043067 [Hibiscus sabdariffa]|uniref:Non-specific lipid-transfer protein n=1 Tax=Hibiscus sabdariffa TaxID=183260 RepID=A0ABR2DI41_9ROSI